MKTSAASDLTVGGPTPRRTPSRPGWSTSASSSSTPWSSAEGSPRSPRDGRLGLELLEEHRFENGVGNLRYRVES